MSRNRIPFFLMICSLCLLLVFLGIWLKQVYKDKYENIQKEAAFLFTNVAKDLEEDNLNRLVLNPMVMHFRDSTKINFTERPSDNLDAVIKTAERFILKKKSTPAKLDTNIRIQFEPYKKIHPNIRKQLTSELSVFVTVDQQDSFPRHPTFYPSITTDSNVYLLIGPKMDEALSTADLPLDYQIDFFSDTIFHTNNLEQEVYTDFLNGDTYAFALADYQSLVLTQMYPEILFSILLFSVISLAFFLIYQNLRQQQRLTDLKNDFISNITHELKTPITTVGVAIEALNNFNALNDPAKTKEYLDISKHELNRLSLLVDKVLKMSLFERKEPELKLESFDLAELTREILNSMKLQFERAAANVQFITEGAHFQMNGDRVHLMSVIYNLLDNALKYSPNDPNITVALENQGEAMQISIQDQGIGIPAAYKEKIFDKFFRVPTGDRHNIKGHGLGLSYVHSVVQKHHGSIHLESEQGKGSCFTINLPI